MFQGEPFTAFNTAARIYPGSEGWQKKKRKKRKQAGRRQRISVKEEKIEKVDYHGEENMDRKISEKVVEILMEKR